MLTHRSIPLAETAIGSLLTNISAKDFEVAMQKDDTSLPESCDITWPGTVHHCETTTAEHCRRSILEALCREYFTCETGTNKALDSVRT